MSTPWVLDPGCGFASLAARLAPCGWRVSQSAQQPLLPGEPEHAVFERTGGDLLHYTFNPVCLLRVIDATRPPDAETLAQLPLVGAESVGAWLASQDERTLWRGVLAARALRLVQWRPRLEALRAHPSAVVARSTQAALQEWEQTAVPTAPALAAASIELLRRQLQPVLLALARDPAGPVLQSLRPREGDHAKAFLPTAVSAARAAYEEVWREPPRVQRASAQAQVISHFAPAGMLDGDNALSRAFPTGYRRLAPLLDPHRVWVAWKVIEPGHDAGMAYDGLVWLDDHWAWFPKPYRALAALLRA